MDEEDKPDYTPQAFDSLRQVPMYSAFIKERFERCLDLYLCPRSKKKRINVDPQSLVPKLPKPQDLQPFPTTLLLRYTGHKARVSTPAKSSVCLWWSAILSKCVAQRTAVKIMLWRLLPWQVKHVAYLSFVHPQGSSAPIWSAMNFGFEICPVDIMRTGLSQSIDLHHVLGEYTYCFITAGSLSKGRRAAQSLEQCTVASAADSE